MITNLVVALVMATTAAESIFPCNCSTNSVFGYYYEYTKDNIMIDTAELPGEWCIIQQHHGRPAEGVEYAVAYPSYVVSTKTNVNDVITSKIKELNERKCFCNGDWWFTTNYVGRVDVFETRRLAKCCECGRIGCIVDRVIRPRWDFLHGGQ